MAAEWVTRTTNTIPDEVVNAYLFPYTWLQYALKHGFLEVTDQIKFANSIQGNVISTLEELNPKIQTGRHKSNNPGVEKGVATDTWIYYRSGSKEIILIRVPDGNTKDVSVPWKKIHTLRLRTVSDILKSTRNEQKTINNSIIQMFAGCGVQLKYHVWKVGATSRYKETSNTDHDIDLSKGLVSKGGENFAEMMPIIQD